MRIGHVSPKNLMIFLEHMSSLMHIMEHDLLRIEKRIEKEERLLHYKDEKHFYEVLELWEKECEQDEELINHFRKIITHNSGIIKPDHTKGKGSFGAGIAGYGALAGKALLFGGISPPALVIVSILSAILILSAFVISL